LKVWGLWFSFKWNLDKIFWAFHIFASSQIDERPKANTPQIAFKVFFWPFIGPKPKEDLHYEALPN